MLRKYKKQSSSSLMFSQYTYKVFIVKLTLTLMLVLFFTSPPLRVLENSFLFLFSINKNLGFVFFFAANIYTVLAKGRCHIIYKLSVQFMYSWCFLKIIYSQLIYKIYTHIVIVFSVLRQKKKTENLYGNRIYCTAI